MSWKYRRTMYRLPSARLRRERLFDDGLISANTRT